MIRELHLDGVVVPAVRPGIAELGPVVGGFHLAAVLVKALLEQTKAITQAVAGQGDVAACGAVQEAGSQTAETAVAQCRVLDILQHGQIHAPLGKELLHFFQNAQIIQVAVNQPADQVFRGEIVGFSLVHPGSLTAVPVVADGHHNCNAQSLVEFLRGCFLQGDVIGIFELRLCPLHNVQAIIIHS